MNQEQKMEQVQEENKAVVGEIFSDLSKKFEASWPTTKSPPTKPAPLLKKVKAEINILFILTQQSLNEIRP